MEFRLTVGYCGSAAAVRIFVINHSSKSFATTFQQQEQLAMSEYWIAHKLHGQLKQSQSMRYCIIRKIIHWVLITQICMYTECSNQKHASSSRLAAHKRKGYRSTCIQWRRTGDKEQGAQIRLGRWDRDGRIEGIMHSSKYRLPRQWSTRWHRFPSHCLCTWPHPPAASGTLTTAATIL